MRNIVSLSTAFLWALLLYVPVAHAQVPNTVFLDELTWMEVADKIDAGTTTVIVATAGTEQNGPHMVLGKHKFIITETAKRIARELENALVAPIVTYVPEGNIEGITGNRQRAGTITLPNEHYMKLLEYTARSLAGGGFTDIVLIGDSGGNQRGMETVAQMLNEEWSGSAARVHFVGDYYSGHGFREWLQEQGHTMEDIGSHAGITDTSQLLYVNARHIRTEKLAPFGGFEGAGVRGDPTQASVSYGRVGIQLKVNAAVRQIMELMSGRR
ncbi:MAG TPA: creatininase family protein [Gemmatimonadetes bacterium]|nr:creatininase family protein [Gemmatimonadota bacterium]